MAGRAMFCASLLLTLPKPQNASETTYNRLTATAFVNYARGLVSHGAKILVAQDAVNAAVRVVETLGCADTAAARTTALGALDGAAGFAVVVFAFEAS